jgi:hypothetical protein
MVYIEPCIELIAGSQLGARKRLAVHGHCYHAPIGGRAHDVEPPWARAPEPVQVVEWLTMSAWRIIWLHREH